MLNSGEQLPENPEQKKDSDHPTPSVRLTEYGKVAVLFLALASPSQHLPYGIPQDNPHTETKKPTTRVDNVRQIATVSSLAAHINVVDLSDWPPLGG